MLDAWIAVGPLFQPSEQSKRLNTYIKPHPDYIMLKWKLGWLFPVSGGTVACSPRWTATGWIPGRCTSTDSYSNVSYTDAFLAEIGLTKRTRVCVCVRMYVRTYVCMYVCMYACMYVCMYLYVHACTYSALYSGSTMSAETMTLTSHFHQVLSLVTTNAGKTHDKYQLSILCNNTSRYCHETVMVHRVINTNPFNHWINLSPLTFFNHP